MGSDPRTAKRQHRLAAARLGMSRPSSHPTAERVTEGLDLSGCTVLITGCSSGIGFETMRVLVLRGAHVLGVARTRDKAAQACAAVTKRGVNGWATPLVCNQADLSSVVAYSETVLRNHAPLDVLICNAGIYDRAFELING